MDTTTKPSPEALETPAPDTTKLDSSAVKAIHGGLVVKTGIKAGPNRRK